MRRIIIKRALKKRKGLKLGSLEEVTWCKFWIQNLQIKKLVNFLKSTSYEEYLLDFLKN